jgi:3'-5' exoribonuclease
MAKLLSAEDRQKLMGKQMVGALRVGEPVDSVFLVAECALRSTRAGGSYLNLVFQDRSGQMVGRLWDATEAFAATIAVDSFVHVKGKVESYQNQLQLNVRTITRAETEGLHLGDFLPQCERDPAEMMRELTAILAQIQDPDYKAVMDAFLSDKDFCADFRTAPAAVQNHHAYLGGLLEHTLSMAQMAVKVIEHYPSLRRDLLLASVFLHDIGKTRELSCKRTFRYTDAGNLIGHITIGVLMLEDRARALPNLPEDKLNMLRHMILSHHGELEFGSPKLPSFAEAIALHYLDNLDAKLKDFAETIAEDKNADAGWTDFSYSLKRRLYKG